MWNKAKNKTSDAIFTFLGSLLAMYINIKIDPLLKKIFELYPVSEEHEKYISSLCLALLIAIGYIISLILWEILKGIFKFIKRPQLSVNFKDETDSSIETLTFLSPDAEPQFLRITFSPIMSNFQIVILKAIKARIVVKFNPRILNMELDEGFQSDNDSEIINNELLFNLFQLFESTTEYEASSIKKDLQVSLISGGTAYVRLGIKTPNKLITFLFSRYCIFKIDKLTIEG